MVANESRAAQRRGRDQLKNLPRAVSARYDSRLNRLLVVLTNRLEVAIAPETVQILQHATPAELGSVEVTAPGFELFFPALDDGLWLPTLLEGTFGTQRWMHSQQHAEVKGRVHRSSAA